MSRVVRLGLCAAFLVLGACASAEEDTGGSVGGGLSGGAEGSPEAPVLEDVIPLAKVLRVRWSVPSACEEIEAERRTDAETFTLAFTAPATDTDHVDEEANTDQTYTYRLRCLLGEETSDWSNTLSANPFDE
ncbi:hypothetical protein [Polyangium aurulentum]|uniref:hypothetical protein n=1 Tax=Polyangium aurulentum TaxID=2567896 RepID=UPI0010AE0186|nr:hypothetical protein [Polyangium aurulentum]UQA55742.1 hypothetical protein E8A73_030965 [Polyangium aurulentum]